MRKRGRPVVFRSWDDFNRAMTSLRQVEDWLVAAGNLSVDREFQSAPGNVAVLVTDVADSYGVYPSRFSFRALDNQTTADSNWNRLTETSGQGKDGPWDGGWCTSITLDEEFRLEKDRRYEGRIIGYWGVGDGSTGTYQYNTWPVVLVYTEEKWHFKITAVSGGLYSGARVKADGSAHPLPMSIVYRIQRFPSNWPNPPGGTPAVPNIQPDQVIEIKSDPDRAGYFYKVDASGGLTAFHTYDSDCNKGYYVARDGVFVPDAGSPPPPIPTTGTWYCVNGTCALYPDTPPRAGPGVKGPYLTKPDCVAAGCP